MLTVSGNYMNGIRGKDSLTINSGTYAIEAAGYGMKRKDVVEANGGEITITSGSDGIQSDNDAGEDKGYVRITGGTTTITIGKKGVLAETLVKVTGGVINIDAQDGNIHNGRGVRIATSQLTLSTGDDAVRSDSLVEVSGGTVAVKQNSEGVEGLCMKITEGTIRINSEDDGINTAGKKDENPAADTLVFESSFGNRRKQDGGSFSVTGGAYIRTSGGDVKINTSGDSIDSNRDLYLEGGAALVEGPAGEGGGALDYDGEGSISEGTILAMGGAGMFRTFSEESSQSILVIYFDEIQAAESTMSVKDGQGSQLTETKVSKIFEILLFSLPGLKIEEIYYIEAEDQSIQVAMSNISNQYGGPLGSGFGRVPGGGVGGFEKKSGAGNISNKASIVEIQEALLAETLPGGTHTLGGRGNAE